MKKYYIFLILICMITITLSCTTKYYDSPTPKGNVPELDNYNKPKQNKLSRYSNSNQSSPKTDANINISDLFQDEMIQNNFQNELSDAYESADKPKIIIFVNNKLDSHLSRWKSDKKVVFDKEGNVSLYNASNDSASGVLLSGPISIAQKTLRQNDYASDVNGKKLWQIEQNFMAPFIKTELTLIDFNTILRQAGLDQNLYNEKFIPIKFAEMKALNKYADIYIELLIDTSNDSTIMKASAKKIDNGEILAQKVSTNLNIHSNKINTNEHGYSLNNSRDVKSISIKSQHLSYRIIYQLYNHWDSNQL